MYEQLIALLERIVEMLPFDKLTGSHVFDILFDILAIVVLLIVLPQIPDDGIKVVITLVVLSFMGISWAVNT